ncbi:MAG: outer membrane beta-barrel family protein [Candidatus Hydrothermales bacterium]
MKTLNSFLILISFSYLFSLDIPKSNFKKGSVIFGYVVDSKTNQALSYATCLIYRKNEEKILKGVLADEKGFFLFDGIPQGIYTLKFDFVGYKLKTISDLEVKPGDSLVDLGKIELEVSYYETEPLEVRGTPIPLKFEIDKKVINVRELQTFQSGSALDILKNVPSINVDIEGNITFRGSQNFQIFVDGRKTATEPSFLLQQIPATSIDRIEIITNPSAKYDPEGTTGIINIVLKKEKREGFNIISNLNLGMYKNYGGDIFITKNINKLNAYISLNYSRREFPNSIEFERTLSNKTFLSKGEYKRGSSPFGIRSGIEYLLKNSTVGFNLNIGEWVMNNTHSSNYFDTNKVSPLFITESYHKRKSPYIETSFYNKTKLKSEKEFLFDLSYSFREGEEYTQTFKKSLEGKILESYKSEESGPSQRVATRLNYNQNIFKNSALEIGLEGDFSESEDVTKFFIYDILKYKYKILYSDLIIAPYLLIKSNFSKTSFQIGFREEFTNRNINLKDSSFYYTFKRWDYFPTIHISHDLKESVKLNSSYSRRIRRPRVFMLEPFVTWLDPYNVRKGNPELKPEYIDSYELSILFPFLKGSLTLESYLKNVYNNMHMVRVPYNDSVFMMTHYNTGSSTSFGFELVYDLSLLRFLSLSLLYDLYYSKQKGSLINEDFKRESFNYNFKLSFYSFVTRNLRIQLNYTYESPTKTPQGERSKVHSLDLSFQSFFAQRKFILSVQIRDLFSSSYHLFKGEGINYSFVQGFYPKTPFIHFALTYNLNSMNFEKRRKRESEDRLLLEEIEY